MIRILGCGRRGVGARVLSSLEAVAGLFFDNSIENGRYDPSLPLALRIGRLFERPVEEIFTLDQPAAGSIENDVGR